jgi:LCP family protein required for cell wall assembly
VGLAILALLAAWTAFTWAPNRRGGALTSLTDALRPLGPVNILLIGNNARNPRTPVDIGTGGGGQADMIMLVHVDPRRHRVTVVSVPRDLLFAMPQYDVPIPKIKTLFFIGAEMRPNQAAELTVQGVERFTGLPVDGWVVTDFQGFVDAINAVGGVRVDIPARIYEPRHSGANFYPGWQTLNGEEALAFVRVRQNTLSAAGNNDFAREEDQMAVLLALKSKLLDPRVDLAHLAALIRTWRHDVVTNLSDADLLRLALAVRHATVTRIALAGPGDSLDIASARLPGINRRGELEGAYYDVVDPAALTRLLRPLGSKGVWTGVDLPSPQSVPVRVLGAAAWAAKLRSAGFPVTAVGTAPSTRPVVLYPPGHLTWGLAVGRALGAGDTWVAPGSQADAVVVEAP